MKKLFTYLAFLAFVLIQNNSIAQIKEKPQSMSLGEENAFYFALESTDIKGIEKVWKKYFKEFGKIKKNKKAKEWQSKEPVNIPTSSSKSYDIYFKLIEKRDIIEAYLWADNGEAFISSESHYKEAKKIKTMFNGFAHQSEVYIIEKLLNAENKKLKKLEKEINKLEKNNDKYHKTVETAKNKIIEFEEKIEQNIIDQETKNIEIDTQRKRVQKVRDNLNNLN